MTKKIHNSAKDGYDRYSRFDFVGEPLPQDESNGGEDHHGRAHGSTLMISSLWTTEGLKHRHVLPHWNA